MIDATSLVIKPLDSSFNRGAFCCGTTPIDNYVKNNVRKEHDLYKIRAFVAHEDGSKDIVGLYSLTIKSLDPDEVSEEAQGKFARVKSVPAIYLACIAVHGEYQGGGVGYRLMQDVFERSLAIAENAGVYAIALDAINEDVAQKYERYGFERFIEGELKMFIPLQLIRDAASAAAADTPAEEAATELA